MAAVLEEVTKCDSTCTLPLMTERISDSATPTYAASREMKALDCMKALARAPASALEMASCDCTLPLRMETISAVESATAPAYEVSWEMKVA